jgi:protein scribble
MVIVRAVTRLVPPAPGAVAPPSLSPLNTPGLPPAPAALPAYSPEPRIPTSTPGSVGSSLNTSRDTEDLVVKVEKIYTTLLRDTFGLGFSIAGGQGATPFKESSECIFVSKITEGGTAMRDGKLSVGDKIVQINGVDVTDARHDQAVQMLTGLERFVRLVVERETLVPRTAAPPSLNTSTDKSPKVFGAPKPYTGLYSANSYMANRPNYGLRTREPGNYGLSTSLHTAEAPATYNKDFKLPGLGGIPGEERRATLPNGSGLLAARSSSTLPSPVSNHQFDALIPESMRGKRSAPPGGAPPAPVEARPAVVTESVTKTTFTETTVSCRPNLTRPLLTLPCLQPPNGLVNNHVSTATTY